MDWCTTLRHRLLQLLVRFAQKVACEVSNTSQSQRRAMPQNIGCVANVRAGDLSAISRAGRHARQRQQCRFISVRSFRLLVLDSDLLLTFVFDLIAVSSCAVCL